MDGFWKLYYENMWIKEPFKENRAYKETNICYHKETLGRIDTYKEENECG